MENKRKSLYRLGSITSILSGLLVVLASCWIHFNGVSGFPSLEAGQVLDGTLSVLHGIDVVTLMLLVPPVAAGYVLLRSEAYVQSLLGTLFALLWLGVELLGHCALTAPLQTLAEFMAAPETESIGQALYALWAEWAEALLMTGTFLCVLTTFCYGLALRTWGNAVAAYLFLLCAIAFPIGALLGLAIELHVLIRGVAFIFFGGVLWRATQVDDDDELGSVEL